MDKTKELGQEKILKLLIKFFIPAIVGTLVNALYNIVDRIYIGRGVGSLALAGLSVTFPIMVITAGFAMLIGMGSGVLVSISLGKKDKDMAEKILGNAFILLIAVAILVSILSFIIKGPILRSFGASQNTIDYANDYLSIILFGTIFQNVGFGLNNLIRSEGNPKIAMYTMLIGAGLNIILDPIFIFVFKMGVQGAALATIISQFANTIWVVSHFRGKNSTLKLKKENFKIDRKIFKDIVAIGMAPFAMQVASSAINILFNKQLMAYGGDLAIGAMGVINSVTMLIVMSMISVNQAVQPIIGYNYGAKQYARVKEALKLAIIGAVSIGAIALVVIEVFPEALIGVFNKTDKELLKIGVNGIRIFLCMLPVIGFQIVGSNYFQAIGRAKVSMLLSLSRQVLILIPMLLILPGIFHINGVWMSAPISDTMATIITAVYLYKGIKSLGKEEKKSAAKAEMVM
ncbi:MATE family efflux transporter [Clostridium bovifaecis]|uniref:Multidrug export protein MepA n=1 Tax=Clostridium bovifaecis TaxID=2184719 RepID=A0A6I6EZ01_9CLOT|nr:MATE family efflux transporter [Clostridium bovifaecis]